jgi:glutathione peroxidase
LSRPRRPVQLSPLEALKEKSVRKIVIPALFLAASLVGGPGPLRAGDKKDVVATAAAASNLKTFGKALAAADLVKTLEGEGPFTVFAPSDQAFAKLPKGELDKLLADKERLKAVLSYHVIPGNHGSKELITMTSAKTLEGAELKLGGMKGVKVNDAKVTKPDIDARNGVIHVIDAVLTPPPKEAAPKADDSFYGLTTTTLEGKTFALSELKGKVTLVVNVASECGFTPQYAGLEKLHAELSSRGFTVVGFPSNEFGGQEPGTPAEIKKFCESRYAVTFPLFSKLVTQPGKDQSPIYSFLTKGRSAPTWNFCKYLVGKDGKVIDFYESRVKPDDADLRAAIEAALK